jgi:TRAP-type C4-dicarboxylate transport system permease small subunit
MESKMKSKNWILPFETGVTSVNKRLSIGSTIFVGLIMIIATVDVITAKLFGVSVPSGKQLIEEFNVLLVFLAIAYVTHERGHIRLTILERWMSNRLAHTFRLLWYVIGALVTGFCTWRAVALVLDSFTHHAQKFGAMYFAWPFQAVTVLGFALLTITFIMLFVKEIKSS